MIELAKITGKLDLFLIVNTNGVSLSQTKIEMLDQLNPNIVFQVSYNSFEIHSNRESWFKADSRKEFIKKHQKQMIIKNTTYNLSRFVLHTYVTPSNVDRMFPIKQYADSL
jgi:competence transcription factor ComK